VRIEITPGPTPEERAAIERALATLVDLDRAAGRGEWWEAGLRENVLEEEAQSSQP
jgi:hypothetical protein